MKKKVLLLFAGILIFAIFNTFLLANSDKGSLELPGLFKFQTANANYINYSCFWDYSCFWYYDNKFQGHTFIIDCFGCVQVPVDNPRYLSTCTTIIE